MTPSLQTAETEHGLPARAELFRAVIEAVGSKDLELAAETCLLALAHQRGTQVAAALALRCGLALSHRGPEQ